MQNLETEVDADNTATSALTKRKKWPLVIGALAAAVLAFNLTVWVTVATHLSSDKRNAAASLHVYRSWLVHPTDITIDSVTCRMPRRST